MVGTLCIDEMYQHNFCIDYMEKPYKTEELKTSK